MFDEEDTQTLVKLGLNVSQAKIYLALIRLETANAKKIAQTAKIDSAETYRQLEKLQGKGLIEKILKNPNEYKPYPLNEAIKMLLLQRNQENNKIQNQIKVLLKKQIKPDREIEEDIISIIPKDEYRKNYSLKEMERAQEEILWYTQIERIPMAMTYYAEVWAKNLAKGVKHRILLELNGPSEKTLKFINDYREKNPNFDVRYIDSNFSITFAIFDNKVLHFSTETVTEVANSRVLSTNNVPLIKVSKDYFELRWKSAKKEYPKKDNKSIRTQTH